MVKLQSWSELGSSTWYQVVLSLLTDRDAKTKLSHWVLHYADKLGLPRPLECLLCRWKSCLPIFISLVPFRDTGSILVFFQRVPLHTAYMCSCYHSEIRRGHLLPGPTNSQAFTGLEFGDMMYFFCVAYKSHFLNWIFPHKIPSHCFSDDIRLFKSHIIGIRDENMQKWLFFFSLISPRQRKRFTHNLSSSESSSAIYQVLVQIISVNMFNLLAMKMLSWHWFWSYMLLNKSWCFCSWAIGWNARACSDTGWDESLQGACVNIAVKKQPHPTDFKEYMWGFGS